MKLNKLLHRILLDKTGKNANRSRFVTFLIIGLIALYGLFSCLPIILAVNQAFKPINEFYIYPPKIIVENPTTSNFKMLFDLMTTTWVPFSRYVFNTFFITIIGTVGNVLICSMAGYPLAKHKAPGIGFLFGLVTVALMFTAMVSDVANYMTISWLGWLDSYTAAVVPAFATSLGLFLMRQFMVQIPDDMIKSAYIDGANEYQIFWRIIMPQVKPAWLTLSIFSFQGLWNTGNIPYIYREELKTMGYALSQIVTGGIVRAGAGAAVGVVMMIVPIMFFVFSQSRIMETMVASGIKE